MDGSELQGPSAILTGTRECAEVQTASSGSQALVSVQIQAGRNLLMDLVPKLLSLEDHSETKEAGSLV
jgi:hypothetical protein